MTLTLPLSRYCLLRTSSLDEVSETYSQLNCPVSLAPFERRIPVKCDIRSVPVGPLTISVHHYGGGIRAATEVVEDNCAFILPIAGSGVVIHGRSQVPVVVGKSASLSSPGGRVAVCLAPGYTSVEVLVNRAVAESALAALTGVSPRAPLRFTPEVSTAAGGGASLSRLVKFLVDEAEHAPEMMAARHVMARYAEIFLFNLTSLLPHSHSALLERSIAATSSQCVRRAEEYIEAHARSPLTLTELAEACDVSVRSLQTAFRKVRSCSPMEFLRARRLELARMRLLAGAATVTDVAMDCHITHLGRFSALYRARFGESPRDTLRRTRGLRK